MPSPDSHSHVTLKDIANALGLSHPTVSLALRNAPQISETTRRRVQTAAVEMGYRPNAMAAGLAHFRRTSKVHPIQAALAWLNFWPEPKALRSLSEFDCYWRGAEETAGKLGYHLEEFVVNNSYTVYRLEQILIARGISGILIPPHPVRVDWGSFRWEHFSVVRFGRSVPSPRMHLVTSNHVSNIVMACKRIRQRGYPRIGFVMSDWEVRRGVLIKAGFLMDQSTVTPEWAIPILSIKLEETHQERAAKLGSWLAENRPDAILTDLTSARDLLEELGYRIPQDIGLAACSILDGNASAGIFQNPEEIGRVAAQLLVSLIDSNEQGVPPVLREILVDGEWIDGATLPSRSA